jgi:hypothetical protein
MNMAYVEEAFPPFLKRPEPVYESCDYSIKATINQFSHGTDAKNLFYFGPIEFLLP